MSDLARRRLIYWIVATVYGMVVFVAGLLIKQDFSYVGFMNSAFYTGGIVLFSGLLLLVTHWGVFDIFVYGFKDVFYHMNPNPNKQKEYKDFPEYIEKKREIRQRKRYTFLWPFLAWGGTYLLVMLILRIIYLSTNGI